MDLLVRLGIAVIVGFLADWITSLFLPHPLPILIGLVLGIVVFLRGEAFLR